MRQKNVTSLLTVLFSFLMLSCNNDDNKEKGTFDGKPVKFSTEIESQERAGGDTWDAGDAIGVYMKIARATLTEPYVLADNKKHTTPGDGNFSYATPADAIYFPEDGSYVDFIAYYPYRSITDYIYPVDLAGNQGGNLPLIDLMYSDNLTYENKDAQDAVLVFSHQLATIVLNIEDKEGNDLAGTIVTITGMKTKSDFSLADATFADDAASVGDIIAAISVNSTWATAQAIILPVTGLNGAKITFNIPSHGKTYKWDIPAGQNFEGKHKYSYDVEIKSDGVVVLNPKSTITNWVDSPGGTIVIGEEEQEGEGTQSNPYTIDQLSEKVGETEKWVTGYIVGSSTKTRAIGIPSTENILIALTADETNEANCISVDISTSVVKANLDIVANPELIGKKIKVQGDIVDSLFGGTLSMTNIMTQEGGAIIGGDDELEFLETFGPTWREGTPGTITKLWNDYVAMDQFDMKAPIVYSTGEDPVDIRCTNTYDNPHVWFAANREKLLKIEWIESGYNNMVLTYDLAANAANASYTTMMVKCNGSDVTVPDGTLGSSNTFSTITFGIPDGTTTIEFYTTSAGNTVGCRLDNIKITGTK